MVGLATGRETSQIQALEAITRALKAMKQAKDRGVDVKPFRRQVKEWRRAFMAADFGRANAISEQILDALTGASRPPPDSPV